MNLQDLLAAFTSPRTTVTGLILALQAFFADINLPFDIPGWVASVFSGLVAVYLVFFAKDKKKAPAPAVSE